MWEWKTTTVSHRCEFIKLRLDEESSRKERFVSAFQKLAWTHTL